MREDREELVFAPIGLRELAVLMLEHFGLEALALHRELALVRPDLRFAELYRRMSAQDAQLFVVPAAFTVPTGQVHWQPLLQARAIESLVYVVAAGQWGEHAGGRKTYGHSMIIGPWGETLSELRDGTGVVCVDLDMDRLADLRQRFPTVQHRREL